MESELVRALSQIGLIEADSTSSAAEKVQSMAKTARQALAAHDAREGERGGIVTGRRKGPNGEDVFTVRPTFGEPFEVTRYAAQPQPSVADWVMVPSEPTQAMLDAAARIAAFTGAPVSRNFLCATFQAMLAAAPQPPEK